MNIGSLDAALALAAAWLVIAAGISVYAEGYFRDEMQHDLKRPLGA